MQAGLGNGNQQIAEPVLPDLVARFNDRRAVELFEDRRPLEGHVERQLLAGRDRRVVPAIAEPDAARAELRGGDREDPAAAPEVEDPIAGEYSLEVSSPGIDRPLTRFKDFSAHEGLEARIELDRMAEGRKRFRGILAGTEIVDGQQMVAIDLEGEEHTALVPFDWIIEAKLVLNDQLMKLGAERRAADLSQSEFMTDADDGDGNIEE